MRTQVSFVSLQSTRLTDGQADGRMDGFLLAIPCIALHVYLQSHGKQA